MREITSIKQIKPHNRNKELDPDFPPLVLERGNRNPEDLPDLNLEAKKKYEAMIERNAKFAQKKLDAANADMELKMA